MPKLHSAVEGQCVSRKMNQCLWLYFACINAEGEHARLREHVLACMSIVVSSYFRNIEIFFILLIQLRNWIGTYNHIHHPISTFDVGWQPSNRRQNFRLPADVKRANRVYTYDVCICQY